jgi:hypothetical protein
MLSIPAAADLAELTRTDEYQEKYRRQVEINYFQEDIIASQNVALTERDGEIKTLRAKEQARRILTVPFTDIALTTEHAQGAIAASIICLIFIL